MALRSLPSTSLSNILFTIILKLDTIGSILASTTQIITTKIDYFNRVFTELSALIIIIIIIIIITVQDQVIPTINYKKYILKQPNTEELCRRCGQNRKQSNTLLQHVSN